MLLFEHYLTALEKETHIASSVHTAPTEVHPAVGGHNIPKILLLDETLSEPSADSVSPLLVEDVNAEVEAARLKIEALSEASVTLPSPYSSLATKEPLLTRTRRDRLIAQSETPSDHPIHKFMRKKIFGIENREFAEWAIELLPIRFIWGPGDVLSLYMAVNHENPLTGSKIDKHEAVLHFIAAIIPFAPSKAITGPVRMARHVMEEVHHALRTGDFSTIKKAFTPKNAIKLAFCFL